MNFWTFTFIFGIGYIFYPISQYFISKLIKKEENKDHHDDEYS